MTRLRKQAAHRASKQRHEAKRREKRSDLRVGYQTPRDKRIRIGWKRANRQGPIRPVFEGKEKET